MCPDETLLTAYVDGEVPSPWKERLELHLAHCNRCRTRVESYRMLDSVLKEHSTIDQAHLERALERVMISLETKSESGHSSMAQWTWRPRRMLASLTSRRILVPLPLFIASMLLMVFFAGLAFGMFGASRKASQALALSTRLPASSTASMESLVSSLAQTAPVELVTINAPDTALSQISGTVPVFVIYHSGSSRPTIMEVPVSSTGGTAR